MFYGINLDVLSFMKDKDVILSGHPAVSVYNALLTLESVDLFHFRKGMTVPFHHISPNVCLRWVFHIFNFSPRFFYPRGIYSVRFWCAWIPWVMFSQTVGCDSRWSRPTLRSQELCKMYPRTAWQVSEIRHR
jgi:hypothetical protein